MTKNISCQKGIIFPAAPPATESPCTHPNLIPGLERCYCPDCRSDFQPRSQEYQSVLEQPKSAPEHTRESDRVSPNPDSYVLEQFKSAPEHTRDSRQWKHWLERYPVPRGNKLHEYYRYLWMDGRKLNHRHIPGGNTKNPIAIGRKAEIERAIADGKSPMEIEQILKSWRHPD